MANFSIQSNIQVIPIEEITFTDTTQKAKGVHSTIDKIVTNSYTQSIGTVSTDVIYKTYIPESQSGVGINTLLDITETSGFKFLMIRLKSKNNEVGDFGIKVTIKTSTEIPFLEAGYFFACSGFSSNVIAEDIMIYGGENFDDVVFEIIAAIYETDV